MSIKLEMTRSFKAPQKKVFEAFTEIDILKQWFAPGQMTIPRVEMEKKSEERILLKCKIQVVNRILLQEL